jgi:hypothetical protein
VHEKNVHTSLLLQWLAMIIPILLAAIVYTSKYSNLHPSTNRKHFRAFVYVWNGAFTVGNGNVWLLMWRVTVQSLIQLFFMFWCAFVYVSVFSSSRYCKSDQTCLYSYFLWLERIIMGLEILKRARRHIKTWQFRHVTWVVNTF